MKLARRKFLKKLFSFYLYLNILPFLKTKKKEEILTLKKVKFEIDKKAVVVKGEDIRKMLRKGIEKMGGIGSFVKRGDRVVIKPNVSWNKKMEFAANTNPFLLGELVKLSFEAGAKDVLILDRTVNYWKYCYKNSGIEEEVKKYGAKIVPPDRMRFVECKLEGAKYLKNWKIARDVLESDVFINVPVAKHHSLAGLTISMKNLMGIVGGARSFFHFNLSDALCDLAQVIKVDLTIIDAYRILVKHGPSGGRKEDVRLKKTLIFSKDMVLADSIATGLFGKKVKDIGYLVEAGRRGIGLTDLRKAEIDEIEI